MCLCAPDIVVRWFDRLYLSFRLSHLSSLIKVTVTEHQDVLCRFRIEVLRSCVTLLDGNAEKGEDGKTLMLKEWAYEGMAACLIIHSAPQSVTGPMLATILWRVTFIRHTAHASAAPYEGTNAQDAAV